MGAGIIIILVALIFLIIAITKKQKGKTNKDSECINCETLGSDADLFKLQVYYNGGIKITEGETIVTAEELTLTVKGFDIKGKEVYLSPNKITWEKSCQSVKFGYDTGIVNTVNCSIKGNLQKNVWVKYGSRTFSWKIQFQ